MIATSLASVEVPPPEADWRWTRRSSLGRTHGGCPSRRAEATLLVSPTGKGYLTVLGSSWDDFVFWLRGIFS